MSSNAGRIFGLDLMRAAAIVLVVFWHSYDTITELAPDFSAPFFLDGVDLFFVLSGYLIGGILLNALRRPGPWHKRLLGFWQRRFFRTLPNYYLFLLISIGLLALGIGPGLLNHNVLAYFAFLQNVWKPFDLFFWEAWSLVVEVWFYILFPIMLFALRYGARMRLRWAFGITILTFILLPLAERIHLAPEVHSLDPGKDAIRKLVITRVDTIVFGVLAALVHARHAALWRSLRVPLFVAGTMGMACLPYYHDAGHMFFAHTFYYSLNAISMALLLPLLSTWVVGPRGSAAITWLSLVSYALFLVHLPVRRLLEPYYSPHTVLAGWLQLIGYWSICMVLAWLIYRYYEKPMTDLRERFAVRRDTRR